LKSLRDIYSAYTEADGNLELKQRAAKSQLSQARWELLRSINDQAFFMMLFACFEGRITDLCKRLVDSRSKASAWRRRRAWDTIDVSRLHFMRKAALLIEKGSADYQRIDGLYDVRCDIAHEAPRKTGAINLAAEYREICRLWRALSA